MKFNLRSKTKKLRAKITYENPPHPSIHEKLLGRRIYQVEATYRVLFHDKPATCLSDRKLLINLKNIVLRNLNLFFIDDSYLRFDKYNIDHLLPNIQKLIKTLEIGDVRHYEETTIPSEQHQLALNLLLGVHIENISYIGHNLDRVHTHFIVWSFHKAFYLLLYIYDGLSEKHQKILLKLLRGMEKRLLP